MKFSSESKLASSNDRLATRQEIASELLACLGLVAPASMGADDRAAWLTIAVDTLSELTIDQLREGCRKARSTCRFPSEIVPAVYGNTFEPRKRYISESGFVYHGEPQEVMRLAEQRGDWNTYWSAKADFQRVRENEALRLERAKPIGKLIEQYKPEDEQ